MKMVDDVTSTMKSIAGASQSLNKEFEYLQGKAKALGTRYESLRQNSAKCRTEADSLKKQMRELRKAINDGGEGAETAAELYASLYEMAQDARLDGDANQEKALSWPLSNAKRLLNAVGCEAVDYTPETAMFYDVMDADITQQRRPAIVQKADGIVQQRGLYLRKG